MVFILPTTRVQRGWRVRPPAWTTWRRRRKRSPRTSSRPTPTAKTSRTWTAAVMNPDVSQRLKRMLQYQQKRQTILKAEAELINIFPAGVINHVAIGLVLHLLWWAKVLLQRERATWKLEKLRHRSQAVSFTKSSRQLQRGRTPTNSITARKVASSSKMPNMSISN